MKETFYITDKLLAKYKLGNSIEIKLPSGMWVTLKPKYVIQKETLGINKIKNQHQKIYCFIEEINGMDKKEYGKDFYTKMLVEDLDIVKKIVRQCFPFIII